MNVFTTKVATAEGAPPDPTKHVRFTYGMVLGVDDFVQEFAYLAARDQWMSRDLIGYGTVSGLRVTVEPGGDKGPRVVVSPGVGVTPRGELVRVAFAQCAYLNDWLRGDDQLKNLQQRAGVLLSPPSGRLDLYVALCYRACDTDAVPIPGEPCRSEQDLTAASRVMDDFRLELRFQPPQQPDEAATRDFVDWLSRIPVVDGASSMTLEDFLAAIRAAAFVVGSPPASPPDFMYGVPAGGLRIGRQDACRYLRGAYRLWVTELRPKWNASWWVAQARCADGAPPDRPQPEECLLLARLDVPLLHVALPAPGIWKVHDTKPVVVDEDARPFLVPSRMLQEWLWCRPREGGAAGPQTAGVNTTTATGTQHNFPLGGAAVVRCNNVSALTLTGFTGGGDGQTVILQNIGTSTVTLAHQNAGSAAANRFLCTSANGQILGANGSAVIWYDGTSARWRVIVADAGSWITPAFSAGDFTGSGGMTWGVDAGDRNTLKFKVDGNELTITFNIETTDVGGAASTYLQIAIPSGYVADSTLLFPCRVVNAGLAAVISHCFVEAGGALIKIAPATTGGNWTLTAADNTSVYGTIFFPVQ